ncbi:MAG: 30S ribosomal protein S16 [candidate division KSB1 bacterium]|nr:30S ribosomal protein S16 [candidate division KSB1 bacterium]MDZ7272966.1 30S ribosomal protein S16 [candidate division KSB1 bacterium]MDZ7285070.1 30S ribosomal protein S16 [candidate division KSB1 bacterium]MDZ7298102.1 30S ribosomal protein S16 [candidate division KSB1 bacterium]MDZ7308221.1 30S ribosomal protein S16 [candidate division KSB1 bacterium]
MAVRLRLNRMGKKKQPIYGIIAIDSRAARDGKYLEKIGIYNPRVEPEAVTVNEERALYWLNVGAQPTDTVRNIFSRRGIMLKWHLKRRGADDAKINEELKKWEALQAEKRQRLELARLQKKSRKKTESEAAPPAETPGNAESNS